MHTYNKVRYWLFQLTARGWTLPVPRQNLICMTLTSWGGKCNTLSVQTWHRVVSRVIVNQCNGLYINCTTVKLVVHITNSVYCVLVEAAGLYTYNKVRYWLLQLCAWAGTFSVPPRNHLWMSITYCGAYWHTLRVLIYHRVGPSVVVNQSSGMYINCTTAKLLVCIANTI